jgi:hypothetical protein
MRTSQKSKRKKAKANRTLAYVSSTLSMARHNLVNMVAITAVSGAVLLALLGQGRRSPSVGYNFRRILALLRVLLCFILGAIIATISARPAPKSAS